jgi:hypothetical protein
LVRFREYRLKLKPQKCELFQKEVEFLGRVVERKGMHIGPGNIKDIEDWPMPKNKNSLNLTKTALRLARCPSKCFPGTRISSRKARTTFQLKPLSTKRHSSELKQPVFSNKC